MDFGVPNIDTQTPSFCRTCLELLAAFGPAESGYQDRLPAMQLPSPMMDLKTGAMQSLRLTTLMTSLQAVVLRKISSLDGKKNIKTSEDEDGSSIENGSLLGGFDCFSSTHLFIYLFIYLFVFVMIEHGCYDC